MSIQVVGSRSWNRPSRAEWGEKGIEQEKNQKSVEDEGVASRRDSFEYTRSEKPVTYSRNSLTEAQVQQLKDDQQQRWENFQRLLQSMVVKQGQKSNLTLFGQRFHVTEADSSRAAAAIAEGGEYSTDAVATRIMDMAKALSGGNPSKIPQLRAAVEKGFQAAGVELGGKLPGICRDTYSEVMKRFDEWEKQGMEESSAGA